MRRLEPRFWNDVACVWAELMQEKPDGENGKRGYPAPWVRLDHLTDVGLPDQQSSILPRQTIRDVKFFKTCQTGQVAAAVLIHAQFWNSLSTELSTIPFWPPAASVLSDAL
jgi:hypothetical protein